MQKDILHLCIKLDMGMNLMKEEFKLRVNFMRLCFTKDLLLSPQGWPVHVICVRTEVYHTILM